MKNHNAPMRSVRKNYLMFKRDRECLSNKLQDGFNETLCANSFFFVEPEVLQASYLYSQTNGVANSLHPMHSVTNKVILSEQECLNIASFLNLDYEGWLHIFPSEWMLCGGGIISVKAFLENIWNLSSLMEDDFDVFDEHYNNMISFRGERFGNRLVECNIMARGNIFIR